ncbi:hypothetical protein Q5P01_025402 [Channa striata]|uniref:Transmembrane protein 154 n=1 Tax=Channa striata TaxID=64152 RepID=A0AA88IPI6_CHASR|nr:hypothetical protein Q5P01_025402 [Channa striata]
MSVSQPGNMSGPRVKTPLLLLLLLTTLTGTVLCENEEIETAEDDGSDSGDTETAETFSTLAPDVSTTETQAVDENTEDHGSGQRHNSRIYAGASETTEGPTFTEAPIDPEEKDNSLDLIIILIPAVLVVLIISMIVCVIFINRRWKKSKNEDLSREDPHLDDYSTEKVPMPMFEDDVPSVLEVEMEELDQWMKKDGETAQDTKHISKHTSVWIHHPRNPLERPADFVNFDILETPTFAASGSLVGTAPLQRRRSAALQIRRRTPKHRQAFPEPLRCPSADRMSRPSPPQTA